LEVLGIWKMHRVRAECISECGRRECCWMALCAAWHGVPCPTGILVVGIFKTGEYLVAGEPPAIDLDAGSGYDSWLRWRRMELLYRLTIL